METKAGKNIVKRRWEGWLRRSTRAATLELTPCDQPFSGAIDFTLARTECGNLMVAAEQGRLCWVGIHDSVEFLESELRADFPGAAFAPDPSPIAPLAKLIVAEIDSGQADLALPIMLDATPFQLSAWRELCAIPRGTTRSYREIARSLGRAEAARAVGHANGSNPLAVIIPCHRAIGADGRLTGYRWGLEYKRRLLEHERGEALFDAVAARPRDYRRGTAV